MSNYQRGGIPEGRKNNPNWEEEMQTRRRIARKTRKCAQCGRPVKPPKRWFCDGTCAEVFFVYYWGLPWDWVRKETLKRDNYTCQKCGFKSRLKRNKWGRKPWGIKDDLEVDHILEVAMGGLDEDKNLQSLCHKCHATKTKEFLSKKDNGQAKL